MAGFGLDYIVLVALQIMGADLLTDRAVGWLFGTSLSWYGNRRITFHSHAPHWAREWIGFLIANLPGFVINIAIFTLIINLWPVTKHHAWKFIPFTLGAFASLVVNYIGSAQVFARMTNPPPAPPEPGAVAKSEQTSIT